MGDRIRTYVGPKVQVTPDEIDFYEKSGIWAAEEKRDGAWAEIRIDESGKIASLTSRVGKPFGGDATAGLIGLQTHLPKSLLVGELETASEAATDRYRALGYRRIHIFDAPILAGMDITEKDYETRRGVVEQFIPSPEEEVSKRLLVVKRATRDFRDFYRDVMADGGEGLVFKKKNSIYRSYASDGKIEDWVRCKPVNTADLILCGLGRTPSNALTGCWGLYRNGIVVEVLRAFAPTKLLCQENVGKLVCEFKGSERMKSGALRHAAWVRVRLDKNPQDCKDDRSESSGSG